MAFASRRSCRGRPFSCRSWLSPRLVTVTTLLAIRVAAASRHNLEWQANATCRFYHIPQYIQALDAC